MFNVFCSFNISVFKHISIIFGEPSHQTSKEQASQDVLFNSYTFNPERPLPLSEQEPLPKVWYSTSLTFAPNRRGTMNLHFGGYVYVQKKRHNRTMNWLCCKGSNTIKTRCKARVSTEGDNKIRFGTHGHNHPATELMAAQKVFHCVTKNVCDLGENFDELRFE
uniref:FLYWCH-type domain-containing protein n=1 Tax=Anopheles darlingi TaxID=43151 RepID=A0A2M4CW59_ANODA